MAVNKWHLKLQCSCRKTLQQQKRETEQTDTQQGDTEELQINRTVMRRQSASAVTEKCKQSLARSNVNEDGDLST